MTEICARHTVRLVYDLITFTYTHASYSNPINGRGVGIVVPTFGLPHRMTTDNCFIVHLDRISISRLFLSLIFQRRLRSGVLECPNTSQVNENWRIKLSLLLIKLMKFLAVPLAILGTLIEFVLNLLSLNGGLLKMLFRLLNGRSIVIPRRGTETFLSIVGLIEDRINLYDGGTHERGSLTRNHLISGEQVIDSNIEPGDRFYADLCVMASTAAYDNKVVIRNRVTEHWKMHFVEFFDFWNDHLQKKSTQAFIFCDKEEDAQLVVIAFRGTQAFAADDWETDFDFSWYQFDHIGKVHLGFLEALGLANRSKKTDIFAHHTSYVPPPDIDKEDPDKALAYYVLRRRLKELLQVHKNAKFMVTGHSLGAALAVLFTSILFIHQEDTLLEKLLAVYTFGQPRVGDEEFAKFMNKNLSKPVPRYFRIVYCNDIVPRVPYDDDIFLYKHFGICLYYNSILYHEEDLPEEPNKNFSLLYFIPIRINAMWELVQSLLLPYIEGRALKETKLSILTRLLLGPFVPGVTAHLPVSYINAVRLSPSTLSPTFCIPPQSKAMVTKNREK